MILLYKHQNVFDGNLYLFYQFHFKHKVVVDVGVVAFGVAFEFVAKVLVNACKILNLTHFDYLFIVGELIENR